MFSEAAEGAGPTCSQYKLSGLRLQAAESGVDLGSLHVGKQRVFLSFKYFLSRLLENRPEKLSIL